MGTVEHDAARAPARDADRAGHLVLVGRQFDYWRTVLRRTWRGSVVTSFVTPLLYVAAMGVILGGYVDAGGADLDGASSYLQFVAPGLLAGQAMMVAMADATYPVYGMIAWDKTYAGMLATPLRVIDIVTAHLLAIIVRAALACGVFMAALALFGLYASWWGALAAFAVQVLLAAAFAAVVYAFTAGLRSDSAFAVLFRVVQVPMYLFSGAFFPIAGLPVLLQWLAVATPLYHGVELTRMAMLGRFDAGAATVHVAYLAALVVLGWWWSVRRLDRRLIS